MNSPLVQPRRLAMAFAAAAVLALAGCGDDDDEGLTGVTPPESVVATDPTAATTAPATSTTSPAPPTTTTPETTTTVPPTTTTPPTTAATTTAAPAPPGITSDTPISLTGIGPIRAGMTLREAAATGVSVSAAGFEDFGGFCYGGEIDGQPDVFMLVEARADEPPADPLDGVIGRVSVYEGERPNTEGVHVGSTEQEVRDAYGAELVETDHTYVAGGHYLRYESAGFAYVFETDGATVTAMHAGDPNVVGYVEGCA